MVDKIKFELVPINKEFLDYLKSNEENKKHQSTSRENPMGYIPNPFKNPTFVLPKEKVGRLPSYFNLSDENKVTKVKDQGKCRSCWAFATYGSLESHLLPNNICDFSENHLNKNHGFDFPICKGGTSSMATSYLTSWKGPVNESDAPYPYKEKRISPVKHVQEVIFYETLPKDFDSVKWIVYYLGAAYSAFNSNNSYKNPKTSAYYCNEKINKNHAVTLVGWNDNYDRHNFLPHTPPGNGAFIVKNSWGHKSGDKGYYYISYYDETFRVEAVFNNAESPNNYSSIYQHDPMGVTSWLNSGKNHNITMCNMFKAKNNESISALGFYTNLPNTWYSISVKNLSKPTRKPEQLSFNHISRWRNGTLKYPGYHTVALDFPILVRKGDYFQCDVSFYNANEYPYAAIETKIKNYSSKSKINRHESFIWDYNLKKWKDMYDLKMGNLCIKAYGKM